MEKKDKTLWFIIGAFLLTIIGLVIVSQFLPKQTDDSKEYDRFIPSEPKEEPLDTCGNNVCEDYELLANCEKDCKDLETHNYGFCRSAGWDGVYRVKVLGTETYLDKGEMIGPDMKPRPNCGYDGMGTNSCFYCHYIDEVHEPIFEIQVTGSTSFSVCENLVKKYFIDGVDQGCKDGKWEYVGSNAYYPYDKKRYDLFKRVNIHD